jgi:signal transduction histidine kinase
MNCSVRSSSAEPTEPTFGLTFSRWGAEANGGRLYARNLPDKGCVFTVDLPRSPGPDVALA